MKNSTNSLTAIFIQYLQSRSLGRLLIDLVFVFLLVSMLSTGWIVSTNFNELFEKKSDIGLTAIQQRSSNLVIIGQKLLNDTHADESYLLRYVNLDVVIPNFSEPGILIIRITTPLIDSDNELLPILLDKNSANPACKMTSLPNLKGMQSLVYSCPVYDINHVILGYIAVRYLSKPLISDAVIFSLLSDAGLQMSGALAIGQTNG